MSVYADPDSVLAAWLEEGPATLPGATRLAILEALPSTPQVRRHPSVAWRPRVSVKARLVAAGAVIVAVALLATVALTGGSSRPVPSARATVVPSAFASQEPAPSGSPVLAAFAPFGYPGSGTITYTTHDAAGNDTLRIVDPSGDNDREVVSGGCCGLFSPDGTLLAVGRPGVTVPGVTRDPRLIGIEVLDHPAPSAAFTIPTDCGSCALLAVNYTPDAWSPDGRYVAYDMWTDSDPTQAGMGIADRDFSIPWDSSRIRVTGSHPDIPIAFSPDSTMLLFLRGEQTAGSTSTGALFLLRLADLSITQVSPRGVTVSTNGLTQGPASWSPDGDTIVFAGVDDSTRRTSIYATRATAGSTPRVLVEDAEGATSARYSPDGSLIAFDRVGPDRGHDLFVVRPDGSNPTNLTADFVPGVCCGQWAPDGRALVVAGTTTDDFHNLLFVVSASGDGIWQVTKTAGVTAAFIWGKGFR